MPIKKRDVDRNLTKKGFVKDEHHDHIYYIYTDPKTNLETRIRTKMSHNDRDLRDPIITVMSKQLHLDRNDFIRFISCEISRDEYNSMMFE